MNSKDFTIGVLSVTAVVLLVGFLVLQAIPPQPALASGQSGTVGDYVVTTAFVDDQSEVIGILDTAAQRVNFYQLESNANRIVLLYSQDIRLQAGAPRDAGRPQRRR